MRLAAAALLAIALSGAAAAAREPESAASEILDRLRPRYAELASRAGINLQPGTPLYERSLRATAQATLLSMDRGAAVGRVPRSFTMPTFGMEPTIMKGELFYALEDYYAGREPRRGDVVLYKVPGQGLSYVRRVIALPGETVEIVRGQIRVDGREFARQRTGIFVDDDRKVQLARYTERLPDGRSYEVLADSEKPRLYNTSAMKLPDRRYLVLGDNREQAVDFDAAGIGVIARENILDRPEIVWLARDPARIGQTVQPR